MTETGQQENSEVLINQAIQNVKQAGFGEVVIKIADSHVVNISYNAQHGLKKQVKQ